MDTFLEKYNIPKLNEEEAESTNKQLNPTLTRTGGTTAKTAQNKKKEGKNQDQSRRN